MGTAGRIIDQHVILEFPANGSRERDAARFEAEGTERMHNAALKIRPLPV